MEFYTPQKGILRGLEREVVRNGSLYQRLNELETGLLGLVHFYEQLGHYMAKENFYVRQQRWYYGAVFTQAESEVAAAIPTWPKRWKRRSAPATLTSIEMPPYHIGLRVSSRAK